MILILIHCKFRNFRENLFSQIMLKDIFVMLEFSQLVHDIHTSVNGGVIFSISQRFHFADGKFRKNKTRTFLNLQYLYVYAICLHCKSPHFIYSLYVDHDLMFCISHSDSSIFYF